MVIKEIEFMDKYNMNNPGKKVNMVIDMVEGEYWLERNGERLGFLEEREIINKAEAKLLSLIDTMSYLNDNLKEYGYTLTEEEYLDYFLHYNYTIRDIREYEKLCEENNKSWMGDTDWIKDYLADYLKTRDDVKLIL